MKLISCRFLKTLVASVIIPLITSCTINSNYDSSNQVNTLNNQEPKKIISYKWTEDKYRAIFENSCIEKEYRSDLDLDYFKSYPSELHTLQITKVIDTSQFTDSPTALILGFCGIGEGGGWGNDLYLIGHEPDEDYATLQMQLIDEFIGLSFDPDLIQVTENGVTAIAEGYSSENEPKCCRDVSDQFLLSFKDNKISIEYLTLNSYQVRKLVEESFSSQEIITEITIPADAKITFLSELAFKKYVGRKFTDIEFKKFKKDIEAFSYRNPKKIQIRGERQIVTSGYDDESLEYFADHILFTWPELREEIGNYYGVNAIEEALQRITESDRNLTSQTTLEELLQ